MEKYIVRTPYDINFTELPDSFSIVDHMGGFDAGGNNQILAKINDYAQAIKKTFTIYYHNILPHTVHQNYKNLSLKFSAQLQHEMNFIHFLDLKIPSTEKNFKNFVCSFSGTEHVSRQFLTSALHKFGWTCSDYTTKNFSTFKDRVDGNISKYFKSEIDDRFYRKFILLDDPGSDEFYNNTISIDYLRFDHKHNMLALIEKINQSFVQIVSETFGTSAVPFVTEKFLYGIVAKSLWVSYGQQHWHSNLANTYGFKLYDTIFNYDFDQIENPVIRLVELLTMLSKFSHLTPAEWHDLYLIEQHTIEYNYDHYISKRYMEFLKKYE